MAIDILRTDILIEGSVSDEAADEIYMISQIQSGSGIVPQFTYVPGQGTRVTFKFRPIDGKDIDWDVAETRDKLKQSLAEQGYKIIAKNN